MSDVKYTNRSFDAYTTPQPLVTPKSPPPPTPEHLYLPPLPPLKSTSSAHSFDTENSLLADSTPDSRNTYSNSIQQQPSPSLNDHHHEDVIVPTTTSTITASTTSNTTAENESESDVNSAGVSRAFSLSSFNRDENEPKDLERPKVISISTSNPSHLFWVPAAQHPEIAPNEFEKFLQINAMAKRERSSLKRRSSILSVSFTASDAEKQEENEDRSEGESRNDALLALERGYPRHEFLDKNEVRGQGNDSHLQHNFQGDEQHMEGLKQRKARLRRSLSLDTATAAENQLRVPDFLVFDRNSSPLDQSRVLVPKADRPSLLRRGARTKFQRNSSFTPPSARQQVDRHRQAESMPPGAYTERFDHTVLDEGITLSDGPFAEPPLDLTLPFADSSSSSPQLPPMHQHEQQPSDLNSLFAPRPMERRASAEELPRSKNYHHHASSPTSVNEIKQLEIGENKVTQESTPLDHTVHEYHQHKQTPHQQQLQHQHQHQQKQQQQQQLDTTPPTRASSERKSAWSWGFKRSKSEQVRGDHHGDKVHLHAESMPRPRPSVSTEASSNTNNNSSMTAPTLTTTAPQSHPPPVNNNGKEKESGKRSFGLSSLFSRKSSSKGHQSHAATTATPSTAPMAPKDFQLNRINQNRLPIHIERAIYRLSHSKLANPRRPLHEQVLISNLMFWYLSLVSSHQQQQQQQAGNGMTPDNKTRKFVNAGKKGKRRPPSPSNSNSPRSSSPQHQQQQTGHDRPPSPSNGSNTTEPRIAHQQQQKNRPPNHPKQHTQQQDNGNAALHQFMGPSTGFVVPENYLKPREQQGTKGMSGVGRRSSLSDSEEDDDDEEEGAMSDSSSDDEPSNNNVTMKARAAAATKHRTSNDLVPNHTNVSKSRGDDDIPLAMYGKGKA